ncbi:hypothetical protein Goklo_002518 [Gossypium klotzschianum]|uniref:Uncharacterized protein n=1 Tax=Gossypium klotzschianum TaxID=34286 RepID=A0A7J8VU02_9ROSI|nr:hypothetical protein [Gossypium klotzschianum]
MATSQALNDVVSSTAYRLNPRAINNLFHLKQNLKDMLAVFGAILTIRRLRRRLIIASTPMTAERAKIRPPATEEKEHLTKYVDKCYNNLSYYQIQAGIDLIAKLQFLLQQDSYSFWTDGRRILAYDAGYHPDGINEEFVNY